MHESKCILPLRDYVRKHINTARMRTISRQFIPLIYGPLGKRIFSKLLLLVYRCTHQLAPIYLTDLVVPYVPPDRCVPLTITWALLRLERTMNLFYTYSNMYVQ